LLGTDHHELTVHTICHAAVSGDRISKILDFESSFETRGKEAAKGGDEGGECCQHKDMELDWGDDDRVGDREDFTEGVNERGWDFEFAGDEDGVWSAVES
jgi:hypothetical protein